MSPLKTRHLELTVLAVVMAFLLALTLAVSSLIWREHEDALRNSAAQSSRFVGGAVAALNRTLLGIDVLLASLEESLAYNAARSSMIVPSQDLMEAVAAYMQKRKGTFKGA